MSQRNKLSHCAAVFPTHDVIGTAEWYRDKLGFSFEFSWGEPVYYTIVHRDEAVSIHFSAAEEGMDIQSRCIYVFCYDVNAIYAELKENGVENITEPKNYDYEMREFDVTDPNGHVITFATGLERLDQ